MIEGEEMRGEDKEMQSYNYDHACYMIGDIRSLITRVDEYIKQSRTETATIQAMLEQHQHVLNGNGQQGIKTRVALLEQSEAGRAKYLFMLISTAVATLGSWIVLLWPKSWSN